MFTIRPSVAFSQPVQQVRSGWEVFKFKQQAADESDELKPNI